MDSRLRRGMIVLSLSAIVMVLLIVAYVNQNRVRALFDLPVSGAGVSSDDTGQPGQSGPGPAAGADLSAFMKDETFFDSDKYYSSLQGDSRTLSLAATSVEKDLRLQIVDGNGFPVRGHSFYVVLKPDGASSGEETEENTSETDDTSGSDGVSGTEDTSAREIEDENLSAFRGAGPAAGEYKDLDQDGVIYIGGLRAGNYTVSLKPESGYDVSGAVLPVTVKDKVEYRTIDDISLLVKTEDEIDPAVEDTGVNGAGEDADDTQDTKLKQTEGGVSLGIDVSKWNQEIDWKKVKEAGITFAVIRCGYRGSSSGVLVEDPYFVQNVRGASENGIDVGIYFFTQAVNEVEAVEEASMVASLCRDYEIRYPVFIDTEGAGGNGRADGLDKATRTAVCRAFAETVKSEGYEGGVYASRNWLLNNVDGEALSDYVIWLAEYRSEPKYEGAYQLWQYTSNGSVDGIEGRVDLNLSYYTP